MASDLDHAQFLKEKFANSFALIERRLSPEIKDLFESIKAELDKKKLQSPESISLLYDLNDTVTNYQLFLTEQNQDVIVKKTFIHCLPISQTRFSWVLKSQLSNIKKLEDLEDPTLSSPPPLPAPTGKDASFEIHGFEEQEKDIVDLLSAPAAFKAIGIYGMCGTGKTTLVQKVLQNARVRADFPVVIWRSMSDILSNDLDIAIVKDILSKDLMEDIDRLPVGGSNDVLFVQLLRRKLLEPNEGYVIVLDDLWCCNDWFCLNDRYQKVETEEEKRTVNCFFNALPRDGAGGAVIVTSRLKEVAEKMVTSRLKEEAEKMVVARNLYHLKPLDSEDESAYDCLRAIVKESLHPKGQDDEELVREIVRRCHGLPLAARILGNKVKVVLIEMEEERKKEEEERRRKEEEESKKEEEERRRKEEEERKKKEEEEPRKKEEEKRMKKEEEERRKKEEEERKKKEEEEHRKKEEEESKKKEEEVRKKKEEEESHKKEEEEGKKEELRKKEEEESKKEEKEERKKKDEDERRMKEEEESKKKEEEDRKRKDEDERRMKEEEERKKKEEEKHRKKEEEESKKKEEEERKKKEEEERRKNEEEEGKKEELRKKEEEEGKKE